MPRHARLDLPGLLQHVIVRGIERRKIFLGETDGYQESVLVARGRSRRVLGGRARTRGRDAVALEQWRDARGA